MPPRLPESLRPDPLLWVPRGAETSTTVTSRTGTLTATPGNADHTVSLSWTPVSGDVSFNVYRGTTSGGETLLGSTTNSTYADTTATDGTEYYYYVQAIGTNPQPSIPVSPASLPSRWAEHRRRSVRGHGLRQPTSTRMGHTRQAEILWQRCHLPRSPAMCTRSPPPSAQPAVQARGRCLDSPTPPLLVARSITLSHGCGHRQDNTSNGNNQSFVNGTGDEQDVGNSSGNGPTTYTITLDTTTSPNWTVTVSGSTFTSVTHALAPSQARTDHQCPASFHMAFFRPGIEFLIDRQPRPGRCVSADAPDDDYVGAAGYYFGLRSVAWQRAGI